MRVVNKIPKMRRVVIKENSIFKEDSISNAYVLFLLYSSVPATASGLVVTALEGRLNRHSRDGWNSSGMMWADPFC
ncbi:unnamed protein product [Arctogadus glacialis]